MFQYAFARYLSLQNASPLILDITSFHRNSKRKFGLHYFYIKGEIVNDPLYIQRLLTKKQFQIYRDHDLSFKPNLLSLYGNIYLDGYWQSWKYFHSISSIIREDFRFKIPPNKKNKKILQEIEQVKDSVCIHVRRGDHVHNPYVRRTHGFVSLPYYKRAINFLSSRIKFPYFFAFSDDIEWVKRYFSLLLRHFRFKIVDINDIEHPQKDLRLMAACKHHIIANSTLSWWGAWLGKHSNQIVCAPKKWFADNSYSSQDLIPEEWIQL